MVHTTSDFRKEKSYAIGLMSGTCTDGIDAALIQIEGSYLNTKVKLIHFITLPYENNIRTRLLDLASGKAYGSKEICMMNVLLGKLSLKACIQVCKEAHVPTSAISFIGSHGHTIYHQPKEESYLGYPLTSTLQIGEPSILKEAFMCPIVSDFRVRDMAAKGNGAPLVPYTEYILYGQVKGSVALQNIGGIGNITFLPATKNINEVTAFDTGPGNMIIDQLVSLYSNQSLFFDKDGEFAQQGVIQWNLLRYLLEDPYIKQTPPKTTGREYYGTSYVDRLVKKSIELNISMLDTIATATMFTAKTIEFSIHNHLAELPSLLVLGGGGSYNPTLVRFIRQTLPACKVVTNEDLGFHSGAKEAVAFAILANETLHGHFNNIPHATGATDFVIMGKITP